MNISSKRTTVLLLIRVMIWPCAFVFVSFDMAFVSWEDCILLFALNCCSSLALALPERGLLGLGVAILLFAVICYSVMGFESVARSVISNGSADPGHAEGVRSMLAAIRLYRPYIVVAAVGLFAMCLASTLRKSVAWN